MGVVHCVEGLGSGMEPSEDPRTVFLLVTSMEFGVVGFALAKHAKENFEQALSQAAQGTGVAFALLAFLAVVSFPQALTFQKESAHKCTV